MTGRISTGQIVQATRAGKTKPSKLSNGDRLRSTLARVTAPSERVDQRFQIVNTTVRTWGRHTVRWGGDFRFLRLDSLSNSNPRGSFVFTGLYTSLLQDGRAVPGTGLDFADFLSVQIDYIHDWHNLVSFCVFLKPVTRCGRKSAQNYLALCDLRIKMY